MKIRFNCRYDFIKMAAGGSPPLAYPTSKPKGVNLAKDTRATPAYRLNWRRHLARTPGAWRNNVFGLSHLEPERRKKWVNEPDIRESHLRHQRRQRVNPLTRIAEQLPRKLKRLT